MKNLFLLLSIVLLSVNFGIAQQPNLQAYHFQVDGQNFYRVLDGKPHSEIEFYSEKWGGKMLKAVNLDAKGYAEVSSEEFSPAFVINKVTGRVYFMEDAEFALERFSVNNAGGINIISWSAGKTAGKEIIFEVFVSEDGKTFKNLSTVQAVKTEDITSYSVTDDQGNGRVYKIKVINSKAGERYVSPAITASQQARVDIYPSLVKDAVSIDVFNASGSEEYFVADVGGQIKKHGKIKETRTEVDMADLPSGMYIISLKGNNISYSRKIIKQ